MPAGAQASEQEGSTPEKRKDTAALARPPRSHSAPGCPHRGQISKIFSPEPTRRLGVGSLPPTHGVAAGLFEVPACGGPLLGPGGFRPPTPSSIKLEACLQQLEAAAVTQQIRAPAAARWVLFGFDRFLRAKWVGLGIGWRAPKVGALTCAKGISPRLAAAGPKAKRQQQVCVCGRSWTARISNPKRPRAAADSRSHADTLRRRGHRRFQACCLACIAPCFDPHDARYSHRSIDPIQSHTNPWNGHGSVCVNHRASATGGLLEESKGVNRSRRWARAIRSAAAAELGSHIITKTDTRIHESIRHNNRSWKQAGSGGLCGSPASVLRGATCLCSSSSSSSSQAARAVSSRKPWRPSLRRTVVSWRLGGRF